MTLRTVLRVVAGAVATIAATLLVAALLPLAGLGAAAFVGPSLPTWLFALSLLACPVAGGAVTGFLGTGASTADTALAALAAALGVLVVGLLSALGLAVVLLGMTPAHAPNTPSFAAVVGDLAPLLAGSGFLAGGALGALGGLAGSAARRRLHG